jgi:hypothetical protein
VTVIIDYVVNEKCKQTQASQKTFPSFVMQNQTMRYDSLLFTALTGLSFTAGNTSSTLCIKINVTRVEESYNVRWPWRSTRRVTTHVLFDVISAVTYDLCL